MGIKYKCTKCNQEKTETSFTSNKKICKLCARDSYYPDHVNIAELLLRFDVATMRLNDNINALENLLRWKDYFTRYHALSCISAKE